MIKYIPYNQDLGSKDAVRIVPYFVLPQFYPIFAYREADAPLLCSYRGGSLSHKTTPVQAHRGFRLLTLASLDRILRGQEAVIGRLLFCFVKKTFVSVGREIYAKDI